ncbi:hypothetical protein KCA24_25275, partial [Escherichia coli]|nr:hypothetical protein [Escherichia coli]
LIGTIITQFALGSVYTWSLFNGALSAKLDAPVSQVAFSFGLLVGGGPFFFFFGENSGAGGYSGGFCGTDGARQRHRTDSGDHRRQ